MPPLTHKHFPASEGFLFTLQDIICYFCFSASAARKKTPKKKNNNKKKKKRLLSCCHRVSTWDQEWDSCDRIFVIFLYSSFSIVGDRGIRAYICKSARMCWGVRLLLPPQRSHDVKTFRADGTKYAGCIETSIYNIWYLIKRERRVGWLK